MTSTPRPNSETMCTSTDDCFCHEHVRQRRSPNSPCAQRSNSSADIASWSTSDFSPVAKQHLLDGVSPQPQPERLEWDDLLRGDVAEVHFRAEGIHEPGLRRSPRRFEDEVARIDRVHDLVDEACAHLAGGAEHARRAALARLGDHLPGAGGELLL